MAADRSLSKDDQAAGQYVCAFDGDTDRDGLVDARQIIARAHADTPTTVYVHRVVDDLPHAFGQGDT